LGAIALTMSSAALNVNAQVGINTENPKTTLDIVQRDTATVKGKGFRLVDGNQYRGYVLTSDSIGVGTWEQSGISMMLGHFPPLISDRIPMPNDATGWIATQAYIDLDPGIWRVDISLLEDNPAPVATSTNKIWVWTSFSSDISNLTTFEHTTSPELGLADGANEYRLVSNHVYASAKFNMIQGTLVIRNLTSKPKRYYLIIRNAIVEPGTVTSSATLYTTAAFNSENTIIAIPITSVNK